MSAPTGLGAFVALVLLLTACGTRAGDDDAGSPLQPDVDEVTPDASGRGGPPEGLDCDVDQWQASPWCSDICLPYEEDLGWVEHVDARGLPVNISGPGCDPFLTYRRFLWRAPYSGSWVFDTRGSEGWILSTMGATCEDPDFRCDAGSPRVVRDMEAGEALIIRAGNPNPFGGHYAHPATKLLNISPLMEREEGAACRDLSDNDADNLQDCWDDDCKNTPACAPEQCAAEVLPSTLPVTSEGELTPEDIAVYGGCGGRRGRVFAWRSPITGRVVATSRGTRFLQTLSVRRGSCTGPQIGHCPYNDSSAWSTGRTEVATSFDVVQGEWIAASINGSPHDRQPFGPYNDRFHYVITLRLSEPETGERCHDDYDNDGNGLVDESDPGCPR